MGTSLVTRLRKLVGLSGKGGMWRFLVILYALLNLKSLPFVWHLRVLNGFLRHLIVSPMRVSGKDGPSALFQPLIITSRSPLLECDFNLHKSNSTYFSDLDVSRTALVTCLCKRGLAKLQESSNDNLGRLSIMLGAVNCSFKREIKPYEAYEVWSRVLCWDRKWMYIVSHFVRKGAIRPKGYLLQPCRKVKNEEDKDGSNIESWAQKTGPNPAIFASAISKYVFKKGRLTILPERILQDSGLLPPTFKGDDARILDTTTPVKSASVEVTMASAIRALAPENTSEMIEPHLRVDLDGVWDWTRVEKERLQGLRIAETFTKLDALSEEFTGQDRPALGMYSDV